MENANLTARTRRQVGCPYNTGVTATGIKTLDEFLLTKQKKESFAYPVERRVERDNELSVVAKGRKFLGKEERKAERLER
jgi:hypothetical protein